MPFQTYKPTGRFSLHDVPGNCCYRCSYPVRPGYPMFRQDGVTVCQNCLYRIPKNVRLEISAKTESQYTAIARFGGRTGN